MKANYKKTKRNHMKEKILLKSGDLITKKGIKETSLSEISKEVGISKGTLYYYYSAKNDIIFDLADKHLNNISLEILELINNLKSNLSSNEILELLFQKILNDETRGKLHFYLINESFTENKIIKERFKEKYKEWRYSIKEGLIKVLKSKNDDYETIAFIILAALDGLIIQKILGLEEIPIKKICNYIIRN